MPHEVVVADGGSADGTAELAERAGCVVVRAGPGRGPQLRAGVAAARAPWLLVLHADSRLDPEALAEAERAVARRGDGRDAAVEFAAWPLRIDAPGAWLRLVELGAALRWRLAGLAYGDQGLLVRRSLYDAAGGYPATRVMEDVVLIRRLRRLARGTRFHHPIRADARRWLREGRVRGTVRNVALLTLFLAGVAPDRLARWYRPEPRAR